MNLITFNFALQNNDFTTELWKFGYVNQIFRTVEYYMPRVLFTQLTLFVK